MRRPAFLLAAVLASVCSPAFAATDAIYTALRASRPDGRTIALQNFVFERDVLRFTLNGTLHLLTPVNGKTPGAVFTGTGSYDLKPATPHEQRQLAVYAADDKLVSLSDTFDTGTVRNTLGLNSAKDFVDNVAAHELGHQWWGHQVAPRTYHDEWISEGFAEFTSALVAQQTGGWPKYNAFWARARKQILERPHQAHIDNIAAGPISQGYRLSTWRNDSAYGIIVYSKGAYVLHMLRMLMTDPKNGDAAFAAMMKDFATTYAGKTASTRDFQRMVEKHATPNMKITTDGSLGWFFDQWVYGTAIPKITSKLEFSPGADGKYKLSGTITQSEVPEDFVSIVPIYVHFDKTSQAKLGAVIVIGSSSKPVNVELPLPKKPQRASVNALHDVLTR